MSQPSRRRRAMTEQAADAAVDQACRSLRLPTLRARFAEIADAADREQLSYRGFLAELLLSECDDRARRRTDRRVKSAGFPREKWLADFDFDANPAINAATCAHHNAGLYPGSKGARRSKDHRQDRPIITVGALPRCSRHLLIVIALEARYQAVNLRFEDRGERVDVGAGEMVVVDVDEGVGDDDWATGAGAK